MLDENRAKTQLAQKAGVDVTEFERKLKEEAWQNIWEDAEDKL